MPSTIEWIDSTQEDTIEYETWRRGGWYWWTSTHDHWPGATPHESGGCGCVSRNYPDRKWRIACDPREEDYTYPTRKAAALAERELMRDAYAEKFS